MALISLTGKIAVALALGAAVLAKTGPSHAGLFDHEVSVKPALSAANQPPMTNTSSIGASAEITYQALTDALNSAVPKTFDANGRQQVCADLTEAVQQTIQKKIGGDVGKLIGKVARFVTQVVTVNQVRHVCQDVDYNVQVSRTSPVTVSAGTNKVHVATNVAITGQAGFTGDLAKALALNKKNFRGAIAASLDIALDVDEHWCPHLQATADYHWNDRAELEIIHNVWLGIEGQVGDQLKNQLNAAVAKLQSTLSCASVTNALKDIWHSYSFPVAIPNVQGASAYVNFTPTGAGFSGISYANSDLALALSLTGTTEVTTAHPPKSPPTELPTLARIPTASDTISVVLPVKVGYDDAANALQNYFKGRTYEAEAPGGHVKATVTGVKIYPSDGKVALALQFSASTGHQIFDTKGTVYLLAVPTLDAGQQTVALKNVSFTAAVDNSLWSTLVSVFNGPIKAVIEREASYDLKPKIAELQSKLQSQLTAEAAKQKIALTFNQGFAGLRDIQLEEKTLDVVAVFNGQADLVVRDITIPPIH